MTQQLVFNRRALLELRGPARSGAMRTICSKGDKATPAPGFGVTHDVGVRVLAWQLGLSVCHLPGCTATAKWEQVPSEYHYLREL